MKNETYENVLERLASYIKGTAFENHVFSVGGCVRDKRLGLEIKDIDLVVDLPDGGINLAKFLESNGFTKGTVVIYENYGTVMFRIKDFPDIELEAVQTRKEDYHDAKTRNPVTCFGTLEEDCRRRDFTINALYYNISERTEYDFNGNSLKDLANGVIDTCGDPDIIFDEDPLRILRAVRFSSKLRFPITTRVKEGIWRHKDRLCIISQERVTDELNKIFSGPHPEEGMEMLYTLQLIDIVLPVMRKPLDSDMYEVIKDMHNIKVRAIEEGLDQLTLMLSYMSYKAGPTVFKEYMKKMRYSSDMTYKVYMYAVLLNKATVVSDPITLRQFGYFAGTQEDYNMVTALAEAIGKLWWKMREDPPVCMFGYKLPVDGNDIMRILNIGPCSKVGEVQNELLRDAFVNPDITKAECEDLIRFRYGKEEKDNKI